MKQGDQIDMRVESLPGLRELVVERMRMAIATGQFPPGARLVERELCEMMGVSRTSLREALRELQADGLIKSQPNKGLTIAVIDRKTAQEIYEVRAVLEGLAARLFARRATPAQMAQLRKSVEKLAKTYANFSADDFVMVKSEFYDTLFKGAGNETATEMLKRIHTRVSQLRVLSLSSAKRAEQSIQELREFLDALERHDEDRAQALCVAHIENAAQAALGALNGAEDSPASSKEVAARGHSS